MNLERVTVSKVTFPQVHQKTKRSTVFVVHGDKLKPYFGETPKSWLEDSAAGPTDSDGTGLTPLMRSQPQCDDNWKDHDGYSKEESNTKLKERLDDVETSRGDPAPDQRPTQRG